MRQLNSIVEAEELLLKFQQPGCITNNYLMPAVLAEYIQEGNLWFEATGSNCCLLLDKGFCFQVFYHLNTLDETFTLPLTKPLVLEIVYRGALGSPGNILEYWMQHGFAKHLIRDNLALTASKIQAVSLNKEVEVSLLEDDQSADFAFQLFSKDLDRFTGDWRSLEEIKNYAKNKQLLFAKIEGKLAGVLQMEYRNNINWLGHIAVSEIYRGKGIANSLVNQFIRIGMNGPTTKYQLWVIQDNQPATRLYSRFGFVYAGKSTTSMLKLNYDK